MKIGVIIPCLLNYRGLAETILSVKSTHELEWFIIPNWEYRWSVAKSWNEGLRRAFSAGCDYALVLNDDVVLSDVCTDRLTQFMDQNPLAILLSGSDVRDEGLSPQGVLTYRPGENFEMIAAPDFACFMVRPQLLDHVGEFDENFTPAYFEDNDMVRRILLSERGVGRLYCAAFYHQKSITGLPGGAGGNTHELFQAAANYYVEKWGAKPGAEVYNTPYNDPALTIKDWRKNVA